MSRWVPVKVWSRTVTRVRLLQNLGVAEGVRKVKTLSYNEPCSISSASRRTSSGLV
jgi:hypothetical protein